MIYSISSIGQDSHRFEESKTDKDLILAGIKIDSEYALLGNSDADVVYHAVTNAISGLMCEPVLGAMADTMCDTGIKDSSAYLIYALELLKEKRPDISLTHLSISIEAKKPKLLKYFSDMRQSLAEKLNLNERSIAITATTGEGLTGMGRGEGIQVICILSAIVDTSIC